MTEKQANNNQLNTKRDENSMRDESNLVNKSKLYGDTPHIDINIYGEQYHCLIDTGSSSTVMSESMYNILKVKKPNLLTLPVRGLLCSSALKKSKQRIKYQSFLPVSIGGWTFELLFLFVPNLNSDFIIGTDALESWNAVIDLEKQYLCVKDNLKGECEIPFLKQGMNVGVERDESEDLLEQDLFFLEYLVLTEVGAMIQTICLENKEGLCLNENDDERLNGLGVDGVRDPISQIEEMSEYGFVVPVQVNTLCTGDIQGVFKEKIDRIQGVTENQKEKIYRIINENSDIFTERIGKCTSYVHEIEVTDLTPFDHKSRIIPRSLLDKTDAAIAQMLRDDVIEESHSSFLNPLCIVLKSDGNVRITVDGRELNARTKPNHFRVEPVERQLEKMNGAKFYSSIDLSQAYLQIEMKENCRQFTAFLHRGKQYRFKRTPFGLASSGAALTRALDGIFENELDGVGVIYVDDIALYSDNLDQHIEDLNFVLTKLRNHGFTIKPQKIRLAQPQIEFLGYLVSADGIRPDPDKVKSILKIPAPRNVRQLRRFLGICQYQSRFLISYAKETEPLRKLLRKDVKWRWTEEANEAFMRVKQLFADAVLLQKPDYNHGYVIYTDSSGSGMGCVLTQEISENDCRVISTASRSLSPPECRMFVAELEVCAIYFALQKFRNFIFGQKVIVRSDNISLSFLQRCRLTSSRISRYIHEITSQDIAIEHVRGVNNVFADVLSRLPRARDSRGSLDHTERNEVVIMKIGVKEHLNLSNKMRNLAEIQLSDPVLSELINKINDDKNEKTNDDKYMIHNKLLYKKVGREKKIWKVCIPDSMVDDLISTYHHHLGHSGIERVVLALEQNFYIRRLANKCRKIISTCELCQKAKSPNVKYYLTPQSILREEPKALVCVDAHGKLPVSNFGHKFIFVIYDVFSKFVKIYPMKNITTKSCLNKVLNDYVEKYGKVEAVLSDNATAFSSPKWREALESRGIKCYHSSKYHACSNPTERVIKDIAIYMRIYCHNKHKSWYSYCALIESILNRCPNPTTKVSPEKLMTGIEPPSLFHGLPETIDIPGQEEVDEKRKVFDRLKLKAEQRKKRIKRSNKLWDIKVGDLVLVKDRQLSNLLKERYHRLELLFRGPCRILEKFGKHTFSLKDERTQKFLGKWHQSMMKPYKTL